MHSLSGIRRKYPYIEEYLPFLYGQARFQIRTDKTALWANMSEHKLENEIKTFENKNQTISHKERMRKNVQTWPRARRTLIAKLSDEPW